MVGLRLRKRDWRPMHLRPYRVRLSLRLGIFKVGWDRGGL